MSTQTAVPPYSASLFTPGLSPIALHLLPIRPAGAEVSHRVLVTDPVTGLVGVLPVQGEAVDIGLNRLLDLLSATRQP